MNALAIHLYLTIRHINLSFNYFGNFYRIIVTYAMLVNPDLFRCILAVSPNYVYSQRMMIDRITCFADECHENCSLYIYLANGKKDKMEESFTPEIKKAADIFSNCSEIVLNYDSLNIEKHSHTIFEGYYRGLLKLDNYIKQAN